MTQPARPDSNTDSIVLDARDKNGRAIKARVRATVLDVPLPESHRRAASSFYNERTLSDPRQERADDLLQDGEDVTTTKGKEHDLLASIGELILPPYSLQGLADLVEMNSELRKAINTMVTNTVGFGWQLRLRKMDEDQQERYKKEIQRERNFLDAMFQIMHATLPVTELRKRSAYDKWGVGNGYLELIHSPTGKLVGMDHVRGHTVYLCKKGVVQVPIEVPMVLPSDGFQIERVTRRHRFRKFVQVLRDGTKVYFKEAGDPRAMNWRTGEYAKSPAELPYEEHATSLVHDLVYTLDSCYGVPLHIAEEESIRGNFAASRINYNTISDNNIPSMFIIVENGELTEGSIDRLKQFTEQQMLKAQNRSKFILLEGGADNEGGPVASQFRIRIEPLKQLQTDDMLFQKYDAANNEKVRQSFRIPPIFVGNAKEYNRATADAARDLADEQVFAPARDEVDHFFNRFVLPAWGIRFHIFRSSSPNITNAMQLLKMGGMTERTGGMTPRRMDQLMEMAFGDSLGPLPKGIDPDVPYSLQHAIAQKHGGIPGSDNPSLAPPDAAPVQRSQPDDPEVQAEQFVEGLVSLRHHVLEAIQRKENGEVDEPPTSDAARSDRRFRYRSRQHHTTTPDMPGAST